MKDLLDDLEIVAWIRMARSASSEELSHEYRRMSMRVISRKTCEQLKSVVGNDFYDRMSYVIFEYGYEKMKRFV